MNKAKQNERILKLLAVGFEQANKLIFNWVKAGDINVKEFAQLTKVNHELPKD